MKALQIGELKTHFSDVIKEVRSGEEIIITYGKKKENIAVIVPYSSYQMKNKIKLGMMENQKYKIHDDFEMTEEELFEA